MYTESAWCHDGRWVDARTGMAAGMTSKAPRWIQSARESWTNRGDQRPDFAVDPGPGQESVWDYPRPPAVVSDTRPVEVRSVDGPLLASATRSIRVLETSHPPAFYLPPYAVSPDALVPAPGRSHCEWKGQAEYVAVAGSRDPVGWRYPRPYSEFEAYAGWVSFYPGRVDCTVDGESVQPQAGGFYGGWITDDVVGPFKGEPGTNGW